MRKPFSPIELVGLLDRLGEPGAVSMGEPTGDDAEQVLVFADYCGVLLSEAADGFLTAGLPAGFEVLAGDPRSTLM